MSVTTGAAVESSVPEPALESPEAVRRRRSLGAFLAAVGVVLVLLALNTSGDAAIAVTTDFSDAPVTFPGQPVVLVLGLVALGLSILHLLGRLRAPRARAWAMAAIGVATVVAFVVWSASGRDLPFQLVNQLQQTVTVAVPLVFGALSGSVGERAGVINVAIEGHFLAAAFTSALVASMVATRLASHERIALTFGLIGAIVAGVAMGLLLAVFALKYRVNQVVLGVVLNVLAAGVTGFLYDQLMQSAQDKYNAGLVMGPVPIPALHAIPFIGPILFDQSLLTYVCYVAVPVVFVVLFRTRWGLRVRAVGEHPGAADTVGIRVNATRYAAMVVAGGLAGLGGAFFTIGYNGVFSKDMTAGYGFIALAAVIMGRWHPLTAAAMALFFGFVNQLQQQIGLLGTPIPPQVLQMFPYIATIVAVAGLIGRVRAPAADGEPYEKG